MRLAKKYVVMNGCPKIYHKIGWLFTRCGLAGVIESGKLYAKRPKGRRLCGNCARSKY